MSTFEESMQIIADSLQGARETISAWRITFSATPDSVLLQNLRRSMKFCLQEMMENLSRVDDDSSEADEQHECKANDANTPDRFEDIDDDEERSENICVITSFYLLLTQNVARRRSPQLVIDSRCLKIMASVHNRRIHPEELLNLWQIPNTCFRQAYEDNALGRIY